MAFTLPNFNLTFSWWKTPFNTPAIGPADLTTLAQLYVNSRPQSDIREAFPDQYLDPTLVRVPMSFVVAVQVTLAWPIDGTILGFIEPVTLKQRYVKVRSWQLLHAGFVNQYAQLMVEYCTATGAVPDPGR